MAGSIRTTQMMNIVLVVALLAGTSSTLAFSSFATYKVNARDKSLGIPTSTNTKSRKSYCQSIQLSPGQRQAHYHGTNTGTRLLQSTNPYGRGAEIWPPSSEQPIRLENSFPNGVLPDNVVEALSRLTAPEQAPPTAPSLVDTGKPLRRQNVPRAIGRILRRAAYAQEETEADAASSVSSSSSSISSVFSRAGRNTAALVDKTPMVLAASLVVFGMIRPLDALVVSFLTGYFVILFLWARSLRRDNVTPIMPSLPPQGHVPNLISNPLGPCLTTFSVTYDYWLRTGVLLGLLAPIVVMLRYAFVSHQMDCAQACARPIFFMCCQAMSESVARRSLTPLPIRILIPVAYNTVRIGYLWNWAFFPVALGSVGRAIAIGNLAYWLTNLFGFLIPVATVRYMRAHFFAVEAEQVTTRANMDSAGLMF